MAWEPPLPKQLLVTSSRVAEELDIPQWKANELCWSLERVYYGEGQVKYRVTRASLDAFKDLLDLGLSLNGARRVMWRYHGRNSLPPSDLTADEAMHLDRFVRRGRKHGSRWE